MEERGGAGCSAAASNRPRARHKKSGWMMVKWMVGGTARRPRAECRDLVLKWCVDAAECYCMVVCPSGPRFFFGNWNLREFLRIPGN
jgi:hypothetical protein